MAEASEDFAVHRFVQELFEDLTLTLPSLGCRFEGTVTASALTVHGRPFFLKNTLFLLFADLASQSPSLRVRLRPAVRGSDLALQFACLPFDEASARELPTWKPELFEVFSSAEGVGFFLLLPVGQPLDTGPAVNWHLLAQNYGGAANGLQILDHFLTRSQTLMAELQAAIQAGDGAAVLRVAHTLKGSARGVTAQALAEAALQLEMLGRGGDLRSAHDLYKDLQVTYDTFIQSVREGHP